MARPPGGGPHVNTELLPVVLADSAVWAGWSFVVGYSAHRLPLRTVERERWLTRIRPWERDGRTWERIGIRRWKDRLPDAGDLFGGGVSKRALPGRHPDELARFAAETRRAELVHWTIPLVLPVFVLWNPPVLLAAMAAYAVVGQRCLHRRAAVQPGPDPPGAAAPRATGAPVVTTAPAVAWFRRDLRLGDNPMLEAASAGGAPVVGLFVADPELLGTAGEHRLGFLAGCLDDLDEQLGGRLVVRQGDPVDVVARVAAEAGATTVHVTEDYGPYGRRRDAAVARALAAQGIELVLTRLPVRSGARAASEHLGGPYRVFTPFHRAWPPPRSVR